MKRIIVSALVITLSFPSILFAQGTGGELSWDVSYLAMKIYAQPYRQSDLERASPFIAARLNAGIGMESEVRRDSQSTKEDDWFGILFGDEDKDTFWVYELYDVDNDVVVKRITLSEMMGIDTGNGCRLIQDSLTDSRIQTEYEIQSEVRRDSQSTKSGAYSLKFYRFISKIHDRNMPGENRLILTFEVENSTQKPVNIRLSVRHCNYDYAMTDPQSANVLYTINRTSAGSDYVDLPMLVQVYSPAAEFTLSEVRRDSQSTNDEPPQQEEGHFTVSKATFPAKIVRRTVSKGRACLGQITFAVATIQDADYVTEQAAALADYLIADQPEPRLSVTIRSDKKEALPGEEITYEILCMHVGTGIAQGGAITAPIPQGVQYVPNSATGRGTAIKYSADNGSTFAEELVPGDTVTHVRWEIAENLRPGESIQMSFKVETRHAVSLQSDLSTQ